MPSYRLASALLFLAGLPFAQAATVIDNVNGYTLNAGNALVRFSSLAFDHQGRIIATGTARAVAARAPCATHIDAGGKTLLPGLIDAHGHIFGLGTMLSQLDLVGTASLADALTAIGAYGAANPQHGWLIGRGWNQEIWKLGRFPTAAELDSAAADRPVWLERVDGHAGWANTRALQLAGIKDDTPDPAGGKIMRDVNGRATGVLIDAAMAMVDRVLPKTTEAQSRAALDGALAQIASMGLTSVHDAGAEVGQDKLYRDYADHGKLTTRVYAMVSGVGADFDALSQAGPLKTYGNEMYALRSVKLYSDGALGSRGAAMLAPYSDEQASRGLLFQKDAAMLALMDKAMARGYQVNVHAIGDGGNRQVLDAYQQLIRKHRNGALRHRIEHAQVVDRNDIKRFASLGIVASMQPTHATSDMNMAEQRVGAERIKGAYAWRTFLKQKSRIACGSDFPVEASNPFFGIHAAVTRQDAKGQPAGGWYANEALTVKQALRCFTLDAAYAGHQEKSIGSLEKGKWADFIIVDRDIFTVPPSTLHATTVLQTWVAGRQVFEKK